MKKQIALKIAKSNGTTLSQLGLRFDKVVMQLSKNLKELSPELIASQKTVLVTLTAPIKVPAKTEKELKDKIRALLLSKKVPTNKKINLYQNNIQLRFITCSVNVKPQIITVVHNRNIHPQDVLSLFTDWVELFKSIRKIR